MFWLYEVFLYLVFVVTAPFFLLTGFLRGKYLSNFPERMGWYAHRAERHDLWIHAVSVGETIAARPVVTAIETLRPDTSLVVTTTTITGQAMARRLYPDATVTFFPFDFAFAVRRFLDHHQPRAFATMETEIWPNVLRLSAVRGIRMLLANARLSDRSFPRYRALRALLRPTIRRYEAILGREEIDRERFIAIGAAPAQVEACGNVKFDFEPDEAPLEIAPRLEALITGRPVLVLGSTMEGEDEVLLPQVERLIAEHDCFVIIAPRKPERFEIVAGLLGLTPLRWARRSEIESAGDVNVLLLDTIGELAKVYRYAVAAFVGGTLVPRGGHNPIEPAAAGAPVCFGPSMSNFRDIAKAFAEAGAARWVGNAAEVAEFAAEMIRSPEDRRRYATAGLETVRRNRGASARTAERIAGMLA
jgi:3-deoxy-D-manno-octulosonic-acid transferase